MDRGPSGNLETGSLLGCLGLLALTILGALIGFVVGGAIGGRRDLTGFGTTVGDLTGFLGLVVGAVAFPILGSKVAARRRRR